MKFRTDRLDRPAFELLGLAVDQLPHGGVHDARADAVTTRRHRRTVPSGSRSREAPVPAEFGNPGGPLY